MVVETKKSEKAGANTKVLVLMAVLGLLIIFSGVQAIELADLKEQINNEFDGLSLQSEDTVKVSSSSNLQNNLQSLPNMVGGC
ncbi:MAG: hypothetical protein CL943_03805 [Candidatus Diapherotrites archaeon]|uniref:Uncharacterized protein n=1 Tax=Candidatus Iainarchaeum sp. TaxID=3101447 RepID=A0A2D6M1T3_9ARCH|nr:hypothetical protein [Candidatus Diapherotrites archaeon]|tara:strand:+ start:285 stop:533 length:249 start_codon:yes stop_codon:yes gene_type:complete